MLHEISGQPIEQFGMGWRFSAISKVTRSPDQSRAKMVEPNAIDKDPSCQRIFLADDGLGELKPSTAFAERFPFFTRREFLRIAPGHFLALVHGVAAFEDTRIF